MDKSLVKDNLITSFQRSLKTGNRFFLDQYARDLKEIIFPFSSDRSISPDVYEKVLNDPRFFDKEASDILSALKDLNARALVATPQHHAEYDSRVLYAIKAKEIAERINIDIPTPPKANKSLICATVATANLVPLLNDLSTSFNNVSAIPYITFTITTAIGFPLVRKIQKHLSYNKVKKNGLKHINQRLKAP